MVPDAEVLKIVQEVLSALLGNECQFTIKCNNRKILDGIFKLSGVPEEKFRSACSSVDKLDKMKWDEVKLEMINEKGLSVESVEMIGRWVLQKGKSELIASLLESELASDPQAKEGLEEMRVLFKYLDLYEITKDVVFDLSLARGLDYYTGVIFEAVLSSKYAWS
jgi:histidyl-tRNA synthetase